MRVIQDRPICDQLCQTPLSGSAARIRSLPADLSEAIELASDSKVLRDARGDHVQEFLIRNKREEWDSYKSYVTPLRAERYLPIL